MANKSESFSPADMQQIMKLAQSDAARQLFTLLQTANSDRLKAAMNAASAGDLGQAKTMLSDLLKDPKATALMEQIKDDANG